MLESKHKLLLADDSITIQKVVNLTFADEGIEVISVGDGNSAMQKFEESVPDLVMADINMPGMSGYEICERIKSSEATRRIPVILLVGSFEPFDEAEARRVGADDYLTKPFQSIRQLVSKVSELLSQSARGEEAHGAVNSFDDTLRMDEDDISTQPTQEFSVSPAASDQLDDVGTDDEMIQSYQVGDAQEEYAAETPTFENEPEEVDYAQTQPLSSEDVQEITAPNYPAETAQEAPGFSSPVLYDTSGYGEVQPEPEYQAENEPEESDARQPEYQDAEVTGGESSSFNEAEYAASYIQNAYDESAGQQPTEEYSQSIGQSENSQSTPMPEAASILELDEMNLLELPPPPSGFSRNDLSQYSNNLDASAGTSQTETSQVAENQFSANADVIEQVSANPAELISEETAPTEPAATAAGTEANLSPEIVDAIASKVVEKISDRVIREIAWEVVPQMTDLIVKRLAEEKLKE